MLQHLFLKAKNEKKYTKIPMYMRAGLNTQTSILKAQSIKLHRL